VILDHLNKIIETLNTYVVPGAFPGLQQQASDAVPPVAQGQEQDEMMWNGMSSNSTDYQSARGLRATGHHLATDQSLTSQDPTVVQQDHSSSEYLQIPPYQTTTDRILQWPIFKAQYPVDCLNGNFLSFDESADQGDSEAVDGDLRKSYRVRSSTGGFGVQEEEIEGLIEYFLASVHIKNPILHADSLRSHARTVAEHGPQWDAKSCLVVSLYFFIILADQVLTRCSFTALGYWALAYLVFTSQLFVLDYHRTLLIMVVVSRVLAGLPCTTLRAEGFQPTECCLQS